MTAHAIATGRPFATRAPGAPRWALTAAHLVPLVALPSGIWRIFVAAGASLGTRDAGAPVDVHGWESVYIVALTLVTEGAALLTLGFVRPWGERFPGWIPLLGGRRVAPRAAVAAGALGALLIGATWGFAFRDPSFPGLEFSSDGWRALMIACYAPLLLWAPLLATVTYDYHRRHAGRRSFR